MIKKKENCEYCGEKMESITAKKRFCSEKCRVYFNRTSKYADKIVSEIDTIAKKSLKLDLNMDYPSFDSFLHEESVKAAKNGKLEPPPGLKGIDLTIWKAENQK